MIPIYEQLLEGLAHSVVVGGEHLHLFQVDLLEQSRHLDALDEQCELLLQQLVLLLDLLIRDLDLGVELVKLLVLFGQLLVG